VTVWLPAEVVEVGAGAGCEAAAQPNDSTAARKTESEDGWRMEDVGRSGTLEAL
jgi:hypothetical protein